MTTVADLVAKLGFKVDDSGFNKFKNSLQAFQSIVREGIKDLKEYAKQAEKISKAFQNAYLPTRAEAKARYNAVTEAMRARSFAQTVRAQWLPKRLAISQLNAESRARQTTLKEAGLKGSGTTGGNALISVIGALSGGFSGLATVIGSAIAGPIGAAFGAVASKIVSGIASAIGWLGRQMMRGLKFAMSYRDYRVFSGRSTTGLGRLAEGTFNTTNMRPEDVLRDALGLETNFWEMMLGGGNPAAYQLLGVRPTGNGEKDLMNIISEIGKQTGGFSNRGLARALFKMFGLSEEYLNVALYRSKDSGRTVQQEINEIIKNSAEVEKVNYALKRFEFELDKARLQLLETFVSSGAFDVIKEAIIGLMKNLPEIVSVFKDLFSLLRSFVEWMKETFPGVFGKENYINKELEKDALGFGSFDIDRFISDSIAQRTSGDYYNRSNLMMNNNYYLNSPDEVIRTSGGVINTALVSAEKFGYETNVATANSPTF